MLIRTRLLRRRSSLALATLGALAAVTVQAQPAPAFTGPPPVKNMTLMLTVFPSSDLEKSIAFYTSGLGMTAVRAPDPREILLTLPGGSAPSLMLLKTAAGPAAPRLGPSRIILQVPDMRALAVRLQGAGYKLKGEIREIAQFHLSVAELEDPDGNSLELLQRSR